MEGEHGKLKHSQQLWTTLALMSAS